MDNNFQVDTSKQVKKDFLKKTEIPWLNSDKELNHLSTVS